MNPLPDIATVIVHFKTPKITSRCIASLGAQSSPTGMVVIVDNDSGPKDVETLRQSSKAAGVTATWIINSTNIGFAGACNQAIASLIGSNPELDYIFLLNSDAILTEDAIGHLKTELAKSGMPHLVSARMDVDGQAGVVDSMGIVMYCSGLASNRKSLDERLLGPTGGLALYSLPLLQEVQAKHGHVFDDAFFCYAEDTDLAWRSILLGFKPHHVERCIAAHVGQASSGGGFNDFVLYHGIRNSIWLLYKGVPASMLPMLLFWAIPLHIGIVLRHTLRGKWRVLLRLYSDAFRGFAEMKVKRQQVQASRKLTTRELKQFISKRFYDRDYVVNALRDLFRLGP